MASLLNTLCRNPTCNNPGALTCARCKMVKYCSKICQKKHWKIHKMKCKTPPPPPGGNPPVGRATKNNKPTQTYHNITIFQSSYPCEICGLVGCGNNHGMNEISYSMQPEEVFLEVSRWYENKLRA